MKRITALLLCFLTLCICSATVFAAELENETTNTVIAVTVPDTHKITVIAENAKVFYEGLSGEEFTVERLSEPRLLIRAENGNNIKSVILNGKDVTNLIYGGYLDLAPVYEDQEITVTTKDVPTDPKDSYTVKGKITLNGEPLSNVNVELRTPLTTTKTDENGGFTFDGVGLGEHSLTVLKNEKVIGYIFFELQKGNSTDVALLQDGSYTISVADKSAGVELYLALNEEKGTLAPTDAITVQKPSFPQTEDTFQLQLWWILLLIGATYIVVLETYHRKKKVK